MCAEEEKKKLKFASVNAYTIRRFLRTVNVEEFGPEGLGILTRKESVNFELAVTSFHNFAVALYSSEVAEDEVVSLARAFEDHWQMLSGDKTFPYVHIMQCHAPEMTKLVRKFGAGLCLHSFDTESSELMHCFMRTIVTRMVSRCGDRELAALQQSGALNFHPSRL